MKTTKVYVSGRALLGVVEISGTGDHGEVYSYTIYGLQLWSDAGLLTRQAEHTAGRPGGASAGRHGKLGTWSES